jgi:hypothetical protein
VLGPFLLHHLFTNQIADGLGAIGVAAPFDETVELGQQRVFQRDSDAFEHEAS